MTRPHFMALYELFGKLPQLNPDVTQDWGIAQNREFQRCEMGGSAIIDSGQIVTALARAFSRNNIRGGQSVS